MIPGVIELSIPALFAAGVAASPHCALMCGAIDVAQLRSRGAVPWRTAQLLLNLGRVCGYALLGAIAGGAGRALLPALPQPLVGTFVQAAAALLLVVAGLHHLRSARRPPACCAKAAPAPGATRLRLFLQGLAWAALPCGILYGMLLLATFSASALSGALLLAAFGLGTTPLLWAGSAVIHRLAQQRGQRALRYGAGGALVLVGAITAAATLAQEPGLLAWCRPLA